MKPMETHWETTFEKEQINMTHQHDNDLAVQAIFDTPSLDL